MKERRKEGNVSLSPSLSFCWDVFLWGSQVEVTYTYSGELHKQHKEQGGTTRSWESKGEILLLVMAASCQTSGDDPVWPQPVAAAIEDWLFLKGRLN